MSVINQVLQDLDRRQGAWNLVPEGVMVGAQPEMQYAAPTGAMHAAAFDAAALPVSPDSLAAPTFSERLNRRWARLQAEPTQRLHLALVASAVVIGSSVAGAGWLQHQEAGSPPALARSAQTGSVPAALAAPAPKAVAAVPAAPVATPATTEANAATLAADVNPNASVGVGVGSTPLPTTATSPAIATATAVSSTVERPAPAPSPATATVVAAAPPTLPQAVAAHTAKVAQPAAATPTAAAASHAVVAAPPAKPAKAAPSTAQAQTQVAALSSALAEAASAKARPPASAPAGTPSTVVGTAPATAPVAMAARPSGETGSIDKRERQQAPRERADAEHQRALALQQQGQSAEAQAAWAAALRADKTHVAARQALALALYQQHQNAEAEALLAEGLALQPQQASLAMLLSRLKLEHQDLTGAIEVLKTALPSEGGSAEARGLLAAQLQRANQHGEAAEHFALALRQNPSQGVWWMGLGISLAADGRNAAAREAFQRARYASGLSTELQAYVEQRIKGL